MKTNFLLIAFALIGSLNAFAISKDHDLEYNFKFSPYLNESFSISIKAKDQFEALERAALTCFSHFKKQRSISSEEGLNLIDVCVNPRLL